MESESWQIIAPINLNFLVTFANLKHSYTHVLAELAEQLSDRKKLKRVMVLNKQIL